LTLCRQIDDAWGTAFALLVLGMIAILTGDSPRGMALSAQSKALFERLGDRQAVTILLVNLGIASRNLGDAQGSAEAAFEDIVAVARETNDPTCMAVALQHLGQLAGQRGEWTRAAALLRDSLEAYLEVSETYIASFGLLEDSARVAMARAEPERAARLLGAAAAQRDALATPVQPSQRSAYEAVVGDVRAVLGGRFAAEWTRGRAMSLDDAIEEARAVSPPAISPAEGL